MKYLTLAVILAVAVCASAVSIGTKCGGSGAGPATGKPPQQQGFPSFPGIFGRPPFFLPPFFPWFRPTSRPTGAPTSSAAPASTTNNSGASSSTTDNSAATSTTQDPQTSTTTQAAQPNP